MARRSRSRQIEIFNFSFLDILACTIGLLIFIMVMVFILQSGSPVADAGEIVRRKSEEARHDQESARQDEVIAAQLERQLARIHDSVKPDLRIARDAAAEQSNVRRAEYDEAVARLRVAEAELQTALAERQHKSDLDLQQAQAQLREARERNDAAKAALARVADAPVTERLHFLPSHKAGDGVEDFQVVHVDCRADAVVFLQSDAAGNMRETDRCPASDLADKDSVFQRIIDQQAHAARPLVLLWVRPDGIDTFNRACRALPEGLAYGFEPANAEWNFQTAPAR
jgi:hypothetical protein